MLDRGESEKLPKAFPTTCGILMEAGFAVARRRASKEPT